MQALLTTSSFSEFIRSELLDSEQAMNPQAHSLMSDQGELLVDYVGRVETIDTDWRAICEKADVPAPSLKVDNGSQRSFDAVEEYWSSEDIQFILKTHRIDFELFDYQIPESVE